VPELGTRSKTQTPGVRTSKSGELEIAQLLSTNRFIVRVGCTSGKVVVHCGGDVVLDVELTVEVVEPEWLGEELDDDFKVEDRVLDEEVFEMEELDDDFDVEDEKLDEGISETEELELKAEPIIGVLEEEEEDDDLNQVEGLDELDEHDIVDDVEELDLLLETLDELSLVLEMEAEEHVNENAFVTVTVTVDAKAMDARAVTVIVDAASMV
jgi:hypothetical protein